MNIDLQCGFNVAKSWFSECIIHKCTPNSCNYSSSMPFVQWNWRILNRFIVDVPTGAEGKHFLKTIIVPETNATITAIPFKMLFNCTFMKIWKTIGIPLGTISHYYIQPNLGLPRFFNNFSWPILQHTNQCKLYQVQHHLCQVVEELNKTPKFGYHVVMLLMGFKPYRSSH